MNLKIIGPRLSFCNIRTPYVADPDENGNIKRSWVVNGICEDGTSFRYNGKDYTTTMVEYEHNGKKHTVPHTDFLSVVVPLIWAEKGLTEPKTPYFNYAYARADQQIGMRSPKIDPKTGDYYAGYQADTCYFYGKTDADKNPKMPIIVDQARVDMPAEMGHPVSGDYVVLLLSAYIFGKGAKRGLSASYNGTQFLRAGEPFGAASATADAFDEQEVEATAGEDDECF